MYWRGDIKMYGGAYRYFGLWHRPSRSGGGGRGCYKENFSIANQLWEFITKGGRTATGIIRTAHLVRGAADQTRRRGLKVASSSNTRTQIINRRPKIEGSQDLDAPSSRSQHPEACIQAGSLPNGFHNGAALLVSGPPHS